jgi:hypothetical protein
MTAATIIGAAAVLAAARVAYRAYRGSLRRERRRGRAEAIRWTRGAS